MIKTAAAVARKPWHSLFALLIWAFCTGAEALPGPELLPSPATFSNPNGTPPAEIASGQAADGLVVVAFISDDELYVQKLTAAGALDGAATRILQGNGTPLRTLSLSVGSGGHYVVGVQRGLLQDARVFIRRFNPDGSPLRSQNEPEDGQLTVAFEEAATCANAAVEATNSPALALDAVGNLAYSFTRSAFCSTGRQGALQPDRTELYYRYAPVAGAVSEAVRVFEQSPVSSAGLRTIDAVASSVALQDNADVLIAWNGHAQSNERPRSFVRTASAAQLTGNATSIAAENSFDRSAPQLGAMTDGYVLSWRGDFNDPQTGSQRIRCYAQARARDGSERYAVVTLASCTERRALIVQSSGAFDVITVPTPGQNQAWSGRRYDAAGVETGFYSNGTLPNRFIDLAPRSWAPTLAGGRYLAIYNVEQSDGSTAVLEPVRYGGPNVPPALALSIAPSAIGVGGQATFTWSGTGASSCTVDAQGEFTFTESDAATSGSIQRTYLQPGTQTFTLSCVNAQGVSASDSRTLTISAPAVTAQASWSPATVGIGELATVNYSSQNADSCQAAISGEFAGGRVVDTSGSLQFTFTRPGEAEFVITCTGPSGSASASARLQVTAPEPSVTASWSSASVRVGVPATLSYSSQNVESCEATLTGEFSGGASLAATSGELQYRFSQTGKQVFTLTCSGPGGSASTSASLTVTAPRTTVTAMWTPETIRVGERATVSFASENAESCQATLTGEFATSAAVPTSGMFEYTFTQVGEQAFTISCSGPRGVAGRTVTLQVIAEEPTVTASWSPAWVRTGELARLNYSSQNAQNCQATLTGEFATGADVPTSGTLEFTFTRADEPVFTLTCTGQGGTATSIARLVVTEPDTRPPNDPVMIELADGRRVELLSSLGRLVNARTVATPVDLPDGLAPITEFLAFDVVGLALGASVEVTLTLPSDMAPTAFIKCAASCVRFEAVQIEGREVRITLTDGGTGDADGSVNGVIQDPGAPAVERAAESGANGGGAFGAPLLLLLAFAALLRVRRRT